MKKFVIHIPNPYLGDYYLGKKYGFALVLLEEPDDAISFNNKEDGVEYLKHVQCVFDNFENAEVVEFVEV